MKKIFILILVLSLASCGSRKVTIDKQKEETKIDSVATTTTEAKQEVKNDVVTTLEASEMVITPVDTTKPIIINNVPYFNAKIEMRQKKESKIDKTISVATEKKVSKIQKKATSNKVVYAKKTEKTMFPWYIYLLLLIPIGYYVYKKYPDKFWWV